MSLLMSPCPVVETRRDITRYSHDLAEQATDWSVHNILATRLTDSSSELHSSRLD